jgi:hypothetical protein
VAALAAPALEDDFAGSVEAPLAKPVADAPPVSAFSALAFASTLRVALSAIAPTR